MVIFSEEKTGTQSIFKRTITDDDGNVVNIRTVICPLYQIKKDGKIFFILYDDKWNVISEAFSYLNFEMKNKSPSTRAQSAYALRMLYCFLSLSLIDIHNISGTSGTGQETLSHLKNFLRGIGDISSNYSMKTQRSGDTINGYLSVYRTYFFEMGIPWAALYSKKSQYVEIEADGVKMGQTVTKYINNERTENSKPYVPSFITPDQFILLIQLAQKQNDQLAIILITLMFRYGFRLGEVLGLTTEDFRDSHRGGNWHMEILLRNRISDRPYQYAKGLPHASDPKEYFSKDYIARTTRIPLLEDDYEMIADYIDAIHLFCKKHYPKNYLTTEADIVSLRNKPSSNHYIFLNRYGRVLSDQTWNNKLREYFIAANIPVDIGVRENNLSHRLRHGFAMFFQYYSGKPLTGKELQMMLRQSNPSSQDPYLKPTPELEIEKREQFLADMFTKIQSLKNY